MENYSEIRKTLIINHAGHFFHAFVFFQNIFFSKKKKFTNIIRVSDSLDPDQDRHFVGHDLGLNCLQRYSADDSLSSGSVLRLLFQRYICLYMYVHIFDYFSIYWSDTSLGRREKLPLTKIELNRYNK